jgi:hypothetical protein
MRASRCARRGGTGSGSGRPGAEVRFQAFARRRGGDQSLRHPVRSTAVPSTRMPHMAPSAAAWPRADGTRRRFHVRLLVRSGFRPAGASSARSRGRAQWARPIGPGDKLHLEASTRSAPIGGQRVRASSSAGPPRSTRTEASAGVGDGPAVRRGPWQPCGRRGTSAAGRRPLRLRWPPGASRSGRRPRRDPHPVSSLAATRQSNHVSASPDEARPSSGGFRSRRTSSRPGQPGEEETVGDRVAPLRFGAAVAPHALGP